MVERYRRKGVDPETILRKVQDSIYGLDINPFAGHLAEMNILFQVIDLITEAKKLNQDFQMEKFNVFQTNSLKFPDKNGAGGQISLLGEASSEFLEDAGIVRQIKLKQGRFAHGFDFVVGNPPYVRQEKLKPMKDDLQKNYECYHGVADLYVYFYELALRLLSDGGRLGFISSNKFFRARYGMKLRRLLGQQNTLDVVIDFGDLPLFEATSYPCILIMCKRPPEAGHNVLALTVRKLDILDRLGKYVAEQAQFLPQSLFVPEGWYLEPTKVQTLLQKIRAGGLPLGEYVQGKFHYGIKTGLNEAFVIDGTTRDRLIEEDLKSIELIKPFLRGQDVRRWMIDHQDQYLLFTRRGIDIERYSAVKGYLAQYKERLLPGSGRKSGNYQWHEIQDTVDYYSGFEKPKVIYPVITDKSCFAFDEQGSYSNDKTFFIPTEERWLLALLNSRLIWFFLRRICSPIRGGFLELRSIYMEQVPIAIAPPEIRQGIETLVNDMLRMHRELPELETLLKDFARFVRDQGVPMQDFADCPGISLHLTKPIGKPSIKVKETEVFLDRNNFIDCPNETTAQYLKLSFESLSDQLRGKTAKELIGLIRLPMPIDRCAEVLENRQALIQEIETIKHRIEELDREIDARVYALYGLTEEEIQIVEGLPR